MLKDTVLCQVQYDCLLFSLLYLDADEVVKVKLAGEQEMIYVEQGKTFDLDIECVDKDGNVIDFGKLIFPPS